MIGDNADSYRVNEKEWEDAFVKLLDVKISCPSCGESTFIDRSTGNQPVCINCGKPIKRVPILKVGRHEVILAPGKYISPCHITSDKTDYKTKVGQVMNNKLNPGVFGLKNSSGISWEALLPDGTSRIVKDNETVKLVKGMHIKFAYNHIGEIM